MTRVGDLTDGVSVQYEYVLPDGTRSDYVLCDRSGRPFAVLEAKRASIDPITAQGQGHHYAEELGVPFVFLSNGEEVWFPRPRDRRARAEDDRGVPSLPHDRDPHGTRTIDRRVKHRSRFEDQGPHSLPQPTSSGLNVMRIPTADLYALAWYERQDEHGSFNQ